MVLSVGSYGCVQCKPSIEWSLNTMYGLKNNNNNSNKIVVYAIFKSVLMHIDFILEINI